MQYVNPVRDREGSQRPSVSNGIKTQSLICYSREMPIFRRREISKGGDEPIYLTPDGFTRLKEKITRLKASLPDLITETARTAAYGDRSENAEYKEAKSTLRRTHRQIWSLEAQLKRVVVIRSNPSVASTIKLGNIVTIEENQATKKFQILDSQESNPDKGRISYKSPLGKALINRRKGETVLVRTPMGARTYKIVEIE